MAGCTTSGLHRYKSITHSDVAIGSRRVFLSLRVQTVQDATHVACFMLHDSCSERFEPSSRAFLIGEQPNPWDLLQPQDKTSRHRGAELRRRYGLLGGTSLLSPE